MRSSWTRNETEVLIRLWPTRSATQIAKELHRPRSAVTSKATRLVRNGMLEADLRTARARAEPADLGSAVKPSLPTNLEARRNELQAPPLEMQPCALIELDGTRCKWPLGDIYEISVQYCGGAAVSGKHYCAHHLRRARGGPSSRHA